MPDQLTFSAQEATHHARKSDPSTSQQAAHVNPGRRGSQRHRLALEFYEVYPERLNWEDAAFNAGIDAKSSPWRRITELVEWGFLQTEGTYKTSLGTEANAYIMTARGFELMHDLEA